jgi:hypothetical protein
LAPAAAPCIPLRTIRDIAHDIKAALQKVPDRSALLQFSDYHGFLKASLPASLTSDALRDRLHDDSAVQIDIVKVETDQKQEIHFHRHASAYIIVLGEDTGSLILSTLWCFCHEVGSPHGRITNWKSLPGRPTDSPWNQVGVYTSFPFKARPSSRVTATMTISAFRLNRSCARRLRRTARSPGAVRFRLSFEKTVAKP